MRNRRPDLNGVLVIDKPLRWTSAQVCSFVRKRTNGAKVGHAGTLDPLATGVLVLCLGSATKAIDSLMATDKRYRTQIDLSRTSETFDLEREALPVEVARVPDEPAVRAALATFVGDILQAPPNHSAVWVDGVRAYNLARRGEMPELAARPVRIMAIDLIEFAWPLLTIDVLCGKGTYIRSLARDIGLALGTGGVLTSLVRTASGEHTVESARSIESLDAGIDAHDLLSVPTSA